MFRFQESTYIIRYRIAAAVGMTT